MRHLVPAILAVLVLLSPAPILGATLATAGVILHALLPLAVVTIIYATLLPSDL